MIDWGWAQTLRDELGEADFNLIAGMFLDEIAAAVAGLDGGDDLKIAADLHFLTGCARSIGLASLARLSHAAEERLHAGGGVDPAAIIRCHADTRRAFLARLNSLPPTTGPRGHAGMPPA
ncbi:MAG: Hpt domain-containing protein [Paracoccus sp. (in: a-proteobacteria)]|nr:Hpt domain-containing protein [Paracoccus sp. (in: a-proteobacteria)]